MVATIAETACEVHLQHLGTSPESGLTSVYPSGFKFICVETAATVDDGDTVTINHLAHGITTVWFIKGFEHTTTDDVIVIEAPTTVTSPSITGQLNIVVGGSNDDNKRVFLIGGV